MEFTTAGSLNYCHNSLRDAVMGKAERHIITRTGEAIGSLSEGYSIIPGTLDREFGQFTVSDDSDAESVSRCVVCVEPIDYCQGHGQSADPIGASILSAHDEGYHGRCEPEACAGRAEMIRAIDSVTEQWGF